MSLIDKIRHKVDSTGDCDVWTGPVDSDGYGRIRVEVTGLGPKDISASRAVYADTFGQIPPDTDVRTLCENRRCVRPGHMTLVSRAKKEDPS